MQTTIVEAIGAPVRGTRRATTHWVYADALRRRFPKARYVGATPANYRARFATRAIEKPTQAASMRNDCAPCQSTSRPTSGRCSRPDVIVRKWLPASDPALLAKCVRP